MSGFQSSLAGDYLAAKTFNRWTLLSIVEPNKYGAARCVCKCECGTVKTLTLFTVVAGKSKSCGCLKKEMSPVMNRTHGLSKTLLYKCCCEQRSRCRNPGYRRYPDYGGRGIEFRFESLIAAVQWILDNLGPRPSAKHSIDRKNNDGHYEPGNLRWATAKEQVANCRPRRKRCV